MTVGYPRTIRQPTIRPEQSGVVRTLARFGYLAKGVVYALIGVLALLFAFGDKGGQLGGGEEAVRTISTVPFGEVLCAVVGIGLLAYAGWRLFEAVLDLQHDGTSGKGIAKRLGYAGSGLMNGAVGVLALDIVIGGGGGGGDASTWVGKLMQSTPGSIIVAVIGLGLILFGLSEIARGVGEKFLDELRTEQMSARERSWVVRAGKVGHVARGVVFPIIGIFLLKAVIERDPGEARGIGGALVSIVQQPFGQVLLAVVAFGLACYGAYQIVFAKYGKLAGR